jgi:Family of unknown function (DUF6491)
MVVRRKEGSIMKRMIASLAGVIAATGVLAATPAVAQPDQKTELVNEDGQSVDSLLLRYAFDATWVIDDTHILMRDTFRDHYYVTLKEPCEKLDMQRDIKFVPALTGRILSSRRYETRDAAGPPCDIVKLEQIGSERAAELRASLANKG